MTTTNKSIGHGGARKGAKRPTFYGAAMERKNLMLDPASISFYVSYTKEDENLSQGVRDFWRDVPVGEIEQLLAFASAKADGGRVLDAVQDWLDKVKASRSEANP